MPGGEGVGGGSVGVDEGLVGGDGGEYGVGVLVGGGLGLGRVRRRRRGGVGCVSRVGADRPASRRAARRV